MNKRHYKNKLRSRNKKKPITEISLPKTVSGLMYNIVEIKCYEDYRSEVEIKGE